jgi:hypothetical protein
MRRVFEVHVRYEIDRLVEMYHLLLMPNQYRAKFTSEIADTLEDALIVGFCTHARNLLEFFYSQSGNDPASVDYAHAPYKRLERKDVVTLLSKLNNQINHLTYGRTEEKSEKIDEYRRKEIIDLIYSEAVRLEQNLKKPDYNAQQLRIDILAAASAVKLFALSPAGTTGTYVGSFSTPPPTSD